MDLGINIEPINFVCYAYGNIKQIREIQSHTHIHKLIYIYIYIYILTHTIYMYI